MSEKELTKLPFTSMDLPVNWKVILDRETGHFLAIPNWLIQKLRNEEWVSDKDMENYRQECLDIFIGTKLK